MTHLGEENSSGGWTNGAMKCSIGVALCADGVSAVHESRKNIRNITVRRDQRRTVMFRASLSYFYRTYLIRRDS